MANVFLTDSENITLKMHECGQDQYWFYYKGSYPADNPLLYQELVNDATSEIIIWDPYFNVTHPNTDHYIFSNIQNNVTIKILTFKGLDRNQTYLTGIRDSLKTIISPARDCRFGLRVINEGDPANQGDFFFHDRFLIIDTNEVFLVGSSIGYHVQSKQSTGIFKVSNQDTKDFIKSIFQHYWDNSTRYQIPLTYLHP